MVYKSTESGYAPSSEGGHTLKPFGTLSTVEMVTDEPLQTSGGHYYDDGETPGVVRVARSNVDKAKTALISGDVGATVVATAAGFAIAKTLFGGR